MAVLEATEVIVREVIQKPKWAARHVPARRGPTSWARVRAPGTARPRASATGAIATVASALRQKAIASGGTTRAAISGAASETASTPTPRSATVRAPGTGTVARAVTARGSGPGRSGG